jgi:hypothetical protein
LEASRDIPLVTNWPEVKLGYSLRALKWGLQRTADKYFTAREKIASNNQKNH